MKERVVLLTVILAVCLVYHWRREIVAAFHFGGSFPRDSELVQEAAARALPLLRAELGALGLEPGYPIFIRVFKETKEMEVWMKQPGKETFMLYRNYRICSYSGGLGPRTSSRDQQAPEGFYYTAPGHLIAKAAFHLGFDLGYPNDYDRANGRGGKRSFIQGGCEPRNSYAIGDRPIEEVYTLARMALENGQPFFRVHCFPFRMTDQRMNQVLEEGSDWLEFWANLKEGYDYFDLLREPPDTRLRDGRYYFE